MRTFSSTVFSGLVLLSVGCASTGKPDPSNGAALSHDDATNMCVRLHEQTAQCAEEFIDAVLSLRAKYEPGFSEVLADPKARAEIRAEGLKEAAADGSGPLEPRRERCAQYAAKGPPVPASDPATLEECYKAHDCAAKLACMKPVLEVRAAAQAQRMQATSRSVDTLPARAGL